MQHSISIKYRYAIFNIDIISICNIQYRYNIDTPLGHINTYIDTGPDISILISIPAQTYQYLYRYRPRHINILSIRKNPYRYHIDMLFISLKDRYITKNAVSIPHPSISYRGGTVLSGTVLLLSQGADFLLILFYSW